MFCKRKPPCFSLPLTTICCNHFIIFLAVAAAQYNFTMGGQIPLLLWQGDRGHQLVSCHVFVLCTLLILCSLSSFFACCHHSLLAVIILCSLSSFLACCPRSWLVVLILGSFSLFFVQCCLATPSSLFHHSSLLAVIWAFNMIRLSAPGSWFFAWFLFLHSFVGSLWFFAQWHCSSLRVAS